nr:hybrid signal transduction histidine kinase M [Tanacetum cinerariifolium]
MAGDDNTPPPSTNNTNEKPYGITNIKTYIPLTLDIDELNYDSWSEIFTLHCKSFGVLQFLEGTSSSPNQTNEEWGKLDSLIKLWIFETISKPLLQRALKKNKSASEVWKMLKDVFYDNKSARAMQLDNDLRNIELENLTITEYFHKINCLADLLDNIGAPVDEIFFVTYAINRLGDKYEQVARIIRHRDPPPTFAQTQSMLLLEESRLARKSNRQSAHDSTSSLPHVLLAATSNNRNNSMGTQLCRNFQRGSCNFGERCRYVHTNPNSTARNGNGNNRSSASQMNNTTGRIMHGARVTFSPTRPSKMGYATGLSSVSSSPQPITNWTSPPTPYYNTTTTIGSIGVLGPAPGHAHVTQLAGHAIFGPSGLSTYTTGPLHGTWGPQVVYGPYVDQETTLSQAFNAMTVQDYGDSGCFSVNDLWTRHLLLRCNSTGDLYPVFPSITSPTALF